MAFLDKLKKGETVECMALENGGRSIRRDVQLRKVGNMLQDTMVNEAYAVVTRPLLSVRGRKKGPVYLVDRDSGCTVDLSMQSTEGDDEDHIRIEQAREVIIDGRRFVGWTVDLVRSRQVASVSTDPSLIGRVLNSSLLADSFGIKAEMRQVLMGLLIGLLVGAFLVGPALF